jgi:uncharacterized protein involved in exopolysaccharide biosynthesis
MNYNDKNIVYVPVSSDFHSSAEDEISLLDLWEVIWRGKWFIVGLTLVCTLLAAYWALYIVPVTYKSEAVLMPMEQQGGASSRLAGLVGSLPIPLDLPTGGKSEQVLTFLQSRNLKQRLIEKYDFLPRLYRDLWDEKEKKWLSSDLRQQPSVVRALQGGVLNDAYTVRQDNKNRLITISWVDEDPAFAALMLEGIIGELRHFLDNEYESDSKRERRFVEQQLAKATQELTRWEKQVPHQELNLATIQRERLAAQTVYTELRKQLEMSKISEAREIINFKVLDAPFIPVLRDKPNRKNICFGALMGSFFVAIVLVMAANVFAKLNAERLERRQGPAERRGKGRPWTKVTEDGQSEGDRRSGKLSVMNE